MSSTSSRRNSANRIHQKNIQIQIQLLSKTTTFIPTSVSMRRFKEDFSPWWKSKFTFIVLIAALTSWPCVHSKYHYEDLNSEEVYPPGKRTHPSGNWTDVGISPPVLNLATKALIEVNATCGERGSETYCKLVEHAYRRSNGPLSRSSQCQVCDAHNSDKGKRHPIRFTIDGSNRWWQSPTLQNGRQYEWVTITIDLKQIYQVAYLIIKAAISPRPGNWILERSLDGVVYLPWQYYAISDDECWNRYRLRATPGKPSYNDDEEVICTSYYSQITPFEGGEIHTSLVNGRPGADGPTEALTRFTMARFVRLRLQKIRTMHGDRMTVTGSPDNPFVDNSVLRRYFYSIKDISIGGHCVCFGHANECVMDKESQSEKCMCIHNTCGDRCDICCPLFNQYRWGAGNSTGSATCEPCQCYGHADSCIYDPIIHQQKLSINIHGEMDGGGVCLDCKDHTTGYNCEKCVEGYYRPRGAFLDDPNPCVKCDCNLDGSMGKCVSSVEEGRLLGKEPGDCFCKDGYEGRRCDRCSMGFRGFPRCSPCPCHVPGIVNVDCEGDCVCKTNVQGKHCGECKKGHFNLIKQNVEGCTQCFCHGVSSDCVSSNFPIRQLSDGQNWFVTDLHGTKTIPAVQIGPTEGRGNSTFTYQIANEEFVSFSEYFWTPSEDSKVFTGNKIHSYGLNLIFHVSWVQARGDTSGRFILNYDLILQGPTSMIGFSHSVYDGDNATIAVTLTEQNCMVLPDVDNHIIQRFPIPAKGTPCTKYDVMEVLSNIKKLLIRAKFHTDQIEGLLHYVFMENAIVDGTVAREGEMTATSVEVCKCPQGYTGSSCQECSYGYRKLNKDSWLTECVKCDCNGHSSSCDFEGNCLECDHNTTGDRCQFCKEGFFGDPTRSESPLACRKCECPLGIPENNFSPTCQLRGNSYECTACPKGYEGEFCERCANGYFGNPAQVGGNCRPCLCITEGDILDSTKDICDHLTGECLVCPRNAIGWNCDQCIVGHYLNPSNGSCTSCECSAFGSTSRTSCDMNTGKCVCKENYTGRKCDRCLEGRGNPLEGCPACGCNRLGSFGDSCDLGTMQCLCKPGVTGLKCERCQDNHYGMNHSGCKVCDSCQNPRHVCDPTNGRCVCPPGHYNFPNCIPCNCDPAGTLEREKNSCSNTGECTCKQNVIGSKCNTCKSGCYGLDRENLEGCYKCFCFKRTKNCLQSNFIWQRLAMPISQDRLQTLVRSDQQLRRINDLTAISDTAREIIIKKDISFGVPLYWQLPHIFLGDKVLSYNGFLRFNTHSIVGTTLFPHHILSTYPVVQIQGNHRLILEHFPQKTYKSGYYQVRLHESEWKLKNGPFDGEVTKEVIMVALQNLQHILIRATYSPEVYNASLFNVSLDIAVPSSNEGKRLAHGIEICECPPEYNSTSCQSPRNGYFRWYKRDYITSTTIIDLIGDVRKCECNDRAESCDPETGACRNCLENTAGAHCEICAEGFYGNPKYGRCLPSFISCSDQCTGLLLNDLDTIARKLLNLNVDPQQVLVWKTMMNLDTKTRKAIAHLNWARGVSLFLEDIPRHETLSEMMKFRAKEIKKMCEKVMMDSYFVVEKGKLLADEIFVAERETRSTVNFFRDYAAGKVIHKVDRSWAQREAGDIITSLENSGMDLAEVNMLAEKELQAVNTLYDVMIVKIFNSSGKAGELLDDMRSARNKLEEFLELISKADKATDEANRVLATAKEFLGTSRVNIETIDNITLNLDLKAVMTETTLSEGGYLSTELEQVLLQLEDILREFRNTTKELEIKDNTLFDKVPYYRTIYAQPAFDHELEMIMKWKYIESLFGSAKLNGSESIQAVTAYDRIKTGFETALQLARNATLTAEKSGIRIQEMLAKYNPADILETSSNLLDAGLILSGQIENALRGNLTHCKKSVEDLIWNVKLGNETLRHMNTKLDSFLESDMKLGELKDRIDEISDTIFESNTMVVETETKVHSNLKARIEAIRGGAPFDAIDAAIEVSRAEHQIPTVQSDIRKQERRQQQMSDKRESLEDKLKYLRALIKQSHHKANTVGVSLGPDDSGTCFRIYKWPSIDSATSILFKFAPTRFNDSLLFYWPSSINEDFVAIEMINQYVKASWDLGSGLRTLIHQTKLGDVSFGSNDPDYWYQINFERIGSSATLGVKPVSTDPTIPTSSIHTTTVKYINSDEEASLLDLSPNDYLHIGGMSDNTRIGLVENGLSGCIHDLQVNHQPLGLWNFARTEGCAPCVECPDIALENMPASGNLEYYFDGRGYSVINRIQSQTFNSRFFDVSIEFKTFSENGLLFLTVNDTIGQIISVELKEGRILMQVRHRWDDQRDAIRVESDAKDNYNTGEWTLVRAVWVFQKGKQVGKLIVGKKDFTQEKRAAGSLSLKLYDATYQIGGISPTFDPSKWDDVLNIVPYVGCMKNILVDGSTYDAMTGLYFGVESPCGGKSVFLTSFEGNGYAEFGSQPIGKNFKLGFSFKTMEPTGLMILSTFARSLDSPDEHYYAVFLEKGQVHVQIGVPQGPFDLTSNGTRYDDGRFHSVRFFKKSRKIFLYVDDDEVMEIRLPKQATATVNAPNGRGLFIGGTTSGIQKKFGETPLQVRQGFKGCIQNFYFGNDLLNFNYPVSYKNQNLGQCPKHHDPDPLLLLHTQHLFPNTIDSGGRYESIVRMTDPECVHHHNPVIEQEEQFKAWHFGDSPNSYATLSLLGSKILKQTFNITFHFRTLYPNGMFFQGLKKRGNGAYCLMSFLKDGQVIVKLHGTRPQDLVSSVSGLNDGKWHQISIIKAEDKMLLHIDGRNATQTQVPKIKAIAKMHIGGVPSDGHDCLENSIHKPEYFKGCLKNFVINSHVYNLDSNSAHLNNVSPCFRNVEPGTFFRTGSYAIFSHNFTLGAMLEVQLDFRSDSRNGVLLHLVPNGSSKFPKFSIFLKDGKIVARETINVNDYYEAMADFLPDKGYVCDGHWHTIRANYEKGSITLRIDNRTPIFALAEPDVPGSDSRSNSGGGGGLSLSSSGVGTIYIGGTDDGASRSNAKTHFHGCIRNIVLNRQIKDWTDMALLHNVFVNSCPL